MVEEYSNERLVRLADEHLDNTLRRLEEGARPLWESQAALGKTLVSLAASALVLSISVAQFAADKIRNPHWGWLLPAAWILFALTVLLGASRQGWLGRARSLRALLEAQRSDIRAKLWNVKPGEDVAEAFDTILNHAFRVAGVEPTKSQKIFNRLTALMYWSFAFGLIALLLFAIRNVPF